jgi:ATP phosphoribosyltransferase
MTLTMALSKGKLFSGTAGLFRRAGLPFPENEGRRLVVETGGLRFLFVKDLDVPTYVEYGIADAGITGRDVLLESGSDVLEPVDLRFGRCRLAVACLRDRRLDYRGQGSVRVATKYPRVAAAYFLEHGVSVEIVKLAGSVELAPLLGLADCIVDVVETGRTLEENGLTVVEDVASSSARLIVNRASYNTRRAEVARIVETLGRSSAS